ncbi:hypothetical protein SprV_0301344000 [Sparganum proliferum]
MSNADVVLSHVSANANEGLCSKAVDTCSCRFHRNWQLPCVLILNYVEQNNVDPCRALLKSRWVFRLDVCEMPVTDENVDPEAVTSFQADILVSKGRGPLTEDYKYRVAMRHVQPIVEKLKSCGSRRFELLREVDAFANWIINAPSGGLHGSLVDLPPQPNADEMEDDTSDEVVPCQVREEGDVLIAQWGSNQDPSVRVLRNDSLLPNFHIRDRPCMRRSRATRKPLRSRPTNTTVSTNSVSTSRIRMDSGIPSWHLDERAVDIDDIPFVDACGVCGGNTIVSRMRGIDASGHSSAILAQLDDDVYDLARAAGISSSMPGTEILKNLRGILCGRTPSWLERSEFRRRTQEPPEGVLEFHQALHLDGLINDMLSHTILDALAGNIMFSTLRLASGYWQVEVRPADREKTAFAVPSGLYEFETMPFGLANAPSTFQRLMNQVLAQLVPTSGLVYMGDIIVLGKDFDSHLKNIRAVFSSLRQPGLTLKPSKCVFLKPRVKFLGHVVSAAGIETDDEKVTQIREWPTPADVTEVRSFLGLASCYRRFIKDYARIAGTLHKLTQKDIKFKWTADCTNSFQTLKDKLCSTPILVFPDITNDAGKFILDTDASDTAIGAVLSQQQSDGTERVIQYLKFRGRFQQPGEGVLDYQQALRLLGRRAFPTMDAAALTQRVLEQFIAGVRNPEVRKALMRGQPPTLDKALDLARQEEALQAVCDRPAQPLLGIAAVRPQMVRDSATQTPWRPCSCGSFYPRQNQWRRPPPSRGTGP